MPTLYVENVPGDLYEALRQRARANRKSISAEVLLLLEENVVTAEEQKSRQRFLRQAQRLRSQPTAANKHFSATEQMQREDRAR
jgi:plasmid stability protein